MRIAFLGDVHGCVRHATSVVNTLDVDLAIQVGDLGAYPSLDALPAGDRAFVDANPAQGDIFELLDRGLRLDVAAPVLFVTGNHDSSAWLTSLHDGVAVVAIDPWQTFFHVACGETLEIAGRRFGFLGDIEEPDSGHDIDLAAAERLHNNLDVLITHDGPFGLATWQGKTQGSAKLLRLIDEICPRLHIHGHYHHRNGPRRYGPTTSYCLAQLVPPRDQDAIGTVADGSVGILDTTTLAFEYVSVEPNVLERAAAESIDSQRAKTVGLKSIRVVSEQR